MSRFYVFIGHTRQRFTLLISALALLALIVAAQIGAVHAAPAPKAYVGLFKDNAVAVIDTGSNKVLTTIAVPVGPHGLVITPDGRTVYVSSDGDTKVSVIDTTTDTIKATIEVGKTPHGLALTGHMLLVAVWGADSVVFIDTTTNMIVGQVSVPNPHNIAIAPDGLTAYVASQKPATAALVILNLVDKTQIGSVALDKVPRALSFRPDGKELYFTQLTSDSVQVLDVSTNKIIDQIAVGTSPHYALVSPNAAYGMVVSQKTNELTMWDPITHKVQSTVKVGTLPHWIALNSDGTVAYVTNETSNDVSVVDLSSGKVIVTIPVGQAPRKIVMQPLASAAGSATANATAVATAS